MKRILAITMTLAMLLGLMTIGASAATSSGYFPTSVTNNHFTDDTAGNSGDASTGNAGNAHAGVAANTILENEIASKEIPVNVTIGGDFTTTHVYAITYDVTEVNFTYNMGGSQIWNPETLQYESDGTNGTWGTTSKTITVKNYSDLAVDVTASADQVTTNEEVAITIDGGTGPVEKSLAAAYKVGGSSVETTTFAVAVDTVTTGTLTGGYQTNDEIQIGTITLTVEKAS